VYVLVYYFSSNGATTDVCWFLYDRVERHSRHPASAEFERMWAAINSVIGTSFWCYPPHSDWALSHVRSLVLDVIFGNYTLTFYFFPVLSFYSFSFSISFFFYLIFIVNNHPEPNSPPSPSMPPSMDSFDTICHLDLFFGGSITMPISFVHPMSRTSAPSQYCVPPPLPSHLHHRCRRC